MDFNSVIRNTVLSLYKNYLKEIELSRISPFDFQSSVFQNLIRCGRETIYGKEKGFSKIDSLKKFQESLPIVKYNDLLPYIKRVMQGEDYVLWNQKVKWFAISSGTSSEKSKYIPITPDSLRETHYGGMKKMLVNYAAQHPKTKIFSTKALTLGGSVTRKTSPNGNSYYGDLSAILLSNSPFYAELIRTPKRSTSLISDFNEKLERICKESTKQNVSSFSGVPSWNLVMLNKILEYAKADNILQVWPNIELFMHGGTNFLHYKEIYEKLIPSDQMHYVENYNASEGYFAFQDTEENGMLLCVNNGVFYEFVPFKHLEEALHGYNTNVVSLEGVTTDIDYAIIVSTVGGLWRYMPEDLVRFTSIKPYKIEISGRTKMFINAFGEELMTDNAEKALSTTCKELNVNVVEFTVAPEFMTFSSGLKKGRHIWAIEFENEEMQKDSDNFNLSMVEKFADLLDKNLTEVNSDYQAKRKNNSTMQRLTIIPLKRGTFMKWMEERGKVGGQNKVPRLWRDSMYINQLKMLNEE